MTSSPLLIFFSQPYKRRSQAMKEAREKEHDAYMRSLSPEDIKRENAFRAAQRKAGKSRKSNLKDRNAPKKPLSAYFMFLQQIRANPILVAEIFGDETETTKQSVLAAAKWRSMTDAERQVNKRGTLPYVVLLIPCLRSRSWHRPSRRKWNTKLPDDCTRRAQPLGSLPTLTLAFCPAVLNFPSSRRSPQSQKARASRRMMLQSGTFAHRRFFLFRDIFFLFNSIIPSFFLGGDGVLSFDHPIFTTKIEPHFTILLGIQLI